MYVKIIGHVLLVNLPLALGTDMFCGFEPLKVQHKLVYGAKSFRPCETLKFK